MTLCLLAVRHGNTYAAVAKDALQFVRCGGAIVDVVQHVRRQHDVEPPRCERQPLGVCVHQRRARRLAASGAQHPERHVDADGTGHQLQVRPTATADLHHSSPVVGRQADQAQHPRVQRRRRLVPALEPQALALPEVHIGRVVRTHIPRHDRILPPMPVVVHLLADHRRTETAIALPGRTPAGAARYGGQATTRRSVADAPAAGAGSRRAFWAPFGRVRPPPQWDAGCRGHRGLQPLPRRSSGSSRGGGPSAWRRGADARAFGAGADEAGEVAGRAARRVRPRSFGLA